MQLAGNAGPKKSPKILGTIAQISGYIFATKALIDNWKKLIKQQCLRQMSSQYGTYRPTGC